MPLRRDAGGDLGTAEPGSSNSELSAISQILSVCAQYTKHFLLMNSLL